MSDDETRPSNINVPNALTVLRIVLVPVFGWMLLAHAHEGSWRSASTIVFIVAIFILLQQADLRDRLIRLAGARDLLVAAGAPAPVAFRAGAYAADDATLDALAALGLAYDSSHNGAEPGRLTLPLRQIAPVAHRGLIEVPVTVIDEGGGRLRPLQLCAASAGEMRAALDHAIA